MITLKDIQENYNKGFITIRKHPFAELYILNYTQLASKKAVWNEVTLNSRGLIINKKGEIISYPFRKFFELEQLNVNLIPKTRPSKIYEKVDGALGIMYWFNDKPYISTRGSFNSYQAVRATEVLHKKYSKHFSNLNRNYTYLFEIIIPENRIVLDYGLIEDLFLIGVINNINQEEIDIVNINENPFPLPKEISSTYSIKQLERKIDIKSEGYVLIYENNFRIKLKSQSYKGLFKFYTHDLKKYAIDKVFSNLTDVTFEDKLNREDYLWLERLINEINILISKLDECDKKCIDDESCSNCSFYIHKNEKQTNRKAIIANRIMSNQFYVDIFEFKKHFI